MNEKWAGIYCAQHDQWLTDADARLFHYPDKAIAASHARVIRLERLTGHLWEGVTFGDERPVNPNGLPHGSEICPVHVPDVMLI